MQVVVAAISDSCLRDIIYGRKMLETKPPTTQLQVCPICQTHNSAFYCYLKPASYFRCNVCGTIFQYPLPTVAEMVEYANQEYSEGLYKGYIQARPIKHLTFRKRLDMIEARQVGQPGKKVLDVGCSCGYFLDVALEKGYDGYGVEFSSVAISAAQDATRARITQGDVNQLAEMQAASFDIVTAFDVIEHTIEPLTFLADLKKLLKPGGLLVITTPDTRHFLRSVMRKRWPMLQPFQHTVLFSGQSLRQALEASGYHSVELRPARKYLTPDYLSEQVKIYTPLLTKIYGVVARVLPKQVRQMPLPLNIGEVMAFARR